MIKKIIFHTSLLLGLAGSEIFSENIFQDSVCFIDFENAQPSIIKDKSTYENHVFPIRSRDNYREGLYGKGIKTDSQNGGFNIKPSDSMIFKDDFTVMFWVKPEKFGDKTKIFSRRNRRDEGNFIILAEEQGFLYAACGQGRDFTLTPKKYKLTLNKWQHITLTLNSRAQLLNLLVDGKLISTTSCHYTVENDKTEFSFGADFEGTTHFFDGYFDNIVFLNKNLSANSVKNHLSSLKQKLTNQEKENLLNEKRISAWLPFDRIDNNYSESWENAAGTAEIKGSGIYLQKGKNKGAISFVGSENSHIIIKNFNDRTLNDNFSIQFWMKPRSEEKKQLFLYIPGTDNKSYIKAIYSKNALYFNILSNDKKYDLKVPEVELHNWHLITVVHDRSYKSVKIYKNQLLVEEISLKHPLADFSAEIYLGNYNLSAKNSPFLGELDELVLYTKQLDSDEISSYYESLNPDPAVLERPSTFIESQKIIDYNFNCDWPGMIEDFSKTGHYASSINKNYIEIFKKGFIGSALSLNNSSKINIETSPLIASASDFTFSFFFKGGDTDAQILSSDSSEQNLLKLYYQSSEKSLNVDVNGEKKVIVCPLGINVWSHVALSYNNRLKIITGYIDGKPIMKNRLQVTSSFDNLLNHLYIGSNNNQVSDETALVDDFSLYLLQLGELEINKLFPKNYKKIVSAKNQQAKDTREVIKAQTELNDVKDEATTKPIEKSKIEEPVKTEIVVPQEKKKEPVYKKPEIIYPLGVPQHPENDKFTWNPSQISNFKKMELSALFFFEEHKDNDFYSNYSSGTIFSIESNNKFINVPAKNGMGAYFDKDSKALISPLKLRLPPKFTILFDIYPVKIDFEEYSLFQMKNKSESLIQAKVVNGRVFIKTANNPGWQQTLILLAEKCWQKIGIAYSHESETLSLIKNGHIVDVKKLSISLSPKMDLLLGQYNTKIPSLNFIVDNLYFFRKSNEEVIKPLNIPANPFIAIQESDYVIRNSDELTVLLHCENASDYILSHSEDFLGTKWKDFKGKVQIPSAHVAGKHKIYCKFKNKDNFETETVSCEYEWGFSNKVITFLNPVENSTIPGRR